MATDTKTKSTTGRRADSLRRRIPRRSASPPSRRQQLTARMQRTLPDRRRATSNSGVHKLTAALGNSQGRLFGGVLGLAAGGMTAAVGVRRRRKADGGDPAVTAPPQSDQSDLSEEPDRPAPIAGDHEQSPGSDPSETA